MWSDWVGVGYLSVSRWSSLWLCPELGIFGGLRNEGNDIAGIVEAVGNEITEFGKGDRVAAFLGFEGGGFADYAVAEASTTFFLPAKTSFQGPPRSP